MKISFDKDVREKNSDVFIFWCFSVNKPLVLPVVSKKPWQRKNLQYNVSEGLPDIHYKIKEAFNDEKRDKTHSTFKL